MRGEVWHSLLQVTEDLIDAYNDLDLDMPTETDHQLDVDIPRQGLKEEKIMQMEIEVGVERTQEKSCSSARSLLL